MPSHTLVIGPITDHMRTALSAYMTLHEARQMEDVAAWLGTSGPSIDYVVTNGHDGIPTDWIASLPNLKLISNYGVGYDAIDTQATNARGILVTHTPDVLNDEVATTALLLLLACYRDLRASEAHVRSDRWATEGPLPLSRTVDHRRIGMVGMGRIGQAIARKLAPFHPDLFYYSRTKKEVPYRYFSDLGAMATEAEVLIVITPGGSGTHHLVSGPVMEALGPDGILINVARGSVVDETALVAALESGTLGMAGLDVFEAEPQVPAALRALPNVVLTPHIGSATVETRQAMGDLTVQNIISHHTTGTVHTPVPECQDMPQCQRAS